MERYLSDLRASLRILRRSPGLAVSAVAALAMGIGFTTIMFSIVHGGTRKLPFAEPHELVAVSRIAVAPRRIRPRRDRVRLRRMVTPAADVRRARGVRDQQREPGE